MKDTSMGGDDFSITSGSAFSHESTASLFFSSKDQPNDSSFEFRLIQTNNSLNRSIHFIASSLSEKQSWCSDISQVIHMTSNANFFLLNFFIFFLMKL